MSNISFKKGPNDIEQPADRYMVFTVYDEKAAAYSTRFDVPTTVRVAIRNFELACQNPESFYNRFPSDYSLYCLGSYDERSGRITPFPEPRFIIRATECLNQLNQPAKEAPIATN